MKKYKFVAWITRNGVRIYAKDYGKKAFRIEVKQQKIVKSTLFKAEEKGLCMKVTICFQ